jgi:hypothetical protein
VAALHVYNIYVCIHIYIHTYIHIGGGGGTGRAWGSGPLSGGFACMPGARENFDVAGIEV